MIYWGLTAYINKLYNQLHRSLNHLITRTYKTKGQNILEHIKLTQSGSNAICRIIKFYNESIKYRRCTDLAFQRIGEADDQATHQEGTLPAQNTPLRSHLSEEGRPELSDHTQPYPTHQSRLRINHLRERRPTHLQLRPQGKHHALHKDQARRQTRPT